MTTYREEYERIIKIHKQYPTFVEWDTVRDDMLPVIALSFAAVTGVFILAIFAIRRLSPRSDAKFVCTTAYQITNFVVNGTLGVLGLYYFNYVLQSNPTIETRVLGDRAVFPMPCIQFGYNLWALPVGLTLVGESTAMLLHHVAVLLASTMSALVTTGHSWYSPFMYGILELSSVPLAIMNAFKNNPHYIQKYPATYTSIRYIFAFSFLYIRWYLYLPLKYDLLRTLCFTVMSHQSTPVIAFMGLTWCASFFLCLLQLMWGFLILKGIFKPFLGRRKKGTKAV